MGTKGKNPKQGLTNAKGLASDKDLTSAKNLTIKLPDGRESLYHRLYELINLT